jgi:crotonobetaine/carnitine-CoA ligase
MTAPSFQSIAHLILDRATTRPDLDVLTFEHEGQVEVRTYAQLWESGQRIAAALASRGLMQGDRFALLIFNHPEFVETMIASAILGTVFVPIDPRTRGGKLAYMLRDSGCKGAICASYSLTGLIEAAIDAPQLRWAMVIDDARVETPLQLVSLVDALQSPLSRPLRAIAVSSESEPMQVMYTSGTTGDPKGIVVPYLRFNAVSNHGEGVFGYRADDRPYTGLSLTHGNAQFVTLAPSLRMGLRAVFSRKFTKSRLWDITRALGCTTFSLLGGMVTAIFSERARSDDADNPVRLVISAGMPAAIWEEFERRFSVDVFEFYGAMEGGMTFKRVGEGPIGSCGRVAPGLMCKVVDESGNEVPCGTSGELWFRPEDGPFPPVTYINNPVASAAKVVNGWLRSGDIVHVDAQSWVFYDYRKDGGIRRNGEFISPAFVEKALALHPAIDDVFVYGMPYAHGAPGEKHVVAAIVTRDRHSFVPQLLFSWARERLESNMQPDFVQIVDEIPKTASEKPQERFLAEMFRNDPGSVHRIR